MAYEKEIVTSTDDDVNISPSEIMTENYQVKNNETKIFETSEYFNGACFDNYCWSQSVNEIGMLTLLLDCKFIYSQRQIKKINFFSELSVLLPGHVRTPKHLRVSIDQLNVKVIDKSNQVVILDETLARKWKASEAVWSVVAGKKLQITVGKFSILKLSMVK